MRVIARRPLVEFCKRPDCRDAEEPVNSWWHEAKRADWSSPADIKEQYGNASILKGNRVVFNIGGNKYRLVVRINYSYKIVYIRFIGTHGEYDKIDAGVI